MIVGIARREETWRSLQQVLVHVNYTIMMMTMAKMTNRCAVQPATPPLQLNETLITAVDSVDSQNTESMPPADGSDRSCASLVVDWFTSMRFDDKSLEQMYDRYVVKFSEYSVNMLLMLLSLVCLTELVCYQCQSISQSINDALSLVCLTELVCYQC